MSIQDAPLRWPITHDELADLLERAAADRCADISEAAPFDQGIYEHQATAVLALLARLRVGVEPVGIKELAELCQTTRKNVDKWRTRYGPKHPAPFPSPRWEVGGRPAWDRPDIEDWGRRTGRLRANGQWALVGEPTPETADAS
jgi:hypothetical protein